MKIFHLTLIVLFLSIPVGFAVDQEQVNRVAEITGVAPNRVAKMEETIQKSRDAGMLIRAKRFDEGFKILEEITPENGFSKIDSEGSRYELARAYKIAGEYQRSYLLLNDLSALSPSWKSTLEDDLLEVKTILDFESSRDNKQILDFVEWFKSQNKPFFPPKGFELDRLARVIRLLEMANEIDRSLELVEQYHAVYFPKKGFKKEPSSIVKRRQEGLKLLKEALLRDKQEGKNIYAQELINTTDYFGFV